MQREIIYPGLRNPFKPDSIEIIVYIKNMYAPRKQKTRLTLRCTIKNVYGKAQLANHQNVR